MNVEISMITSSPNAACICFKNFCLCLPARLPPARSNLPPGSLLPRAAPEALCPRTFPSPILAPPAAAAASTGGGGGAQPVEDGGLERRRAATLHGRGWGACWWCRAARQLWPWPEVFRQSGVVEVVVCHRRTWCSNLIWVSWPDLGLLAD